MKIELSPKCPKWSTRQLRAITTRVWNLLRPDLTSGQRESVEWKTGTITIRFRNRGQSYGMRTVAVTRDVTQHQFALLMLACLRARAGLTNAWGTLPTGHFSDDYLPLRAKPKARAALPPLAKNEKQLGDLRARLRLAESRVRNLKTRILKAERKNARQRKRIIAADDTSKLGSASFSERMRARRQEQANASPD